MSNENQTETKPVEQHPQLNKQPHKQQKTC